MARIWDPERGEGGWIAGVNIRGNELYLGRPSETLEILSFMLELKVEIRQPCTTLVDNTPILGPRMNIVHDVAQHWRTLYNAHESCLSENEKPMPTRVLALCREHTRPSTQLIESRGHKGQYMTLSHCWDSTER